VVSIHKKGDPAGVCNCSGTSLIPAPFKLPLAVTAVRVQKATGERERVVLAAESKLNSGLKRSAQGKWLP